MQPGLIVEMLYGQDQEPIYIALCGFPGLENYWTVWQGEQAMTTPSLFAAVDAALELKQYGTFGPLSYDFYEDEDNDTDADE